jgi:hypothetical protein
MNLDSLVVSASAAKPFWVAAALAEFPPSQIAPVAEDIFLWSDNVTAGGVIGLIGANRINDFLLKAGLANTALVYWGFGGEFVADSYPGPLDGDNYTTVADAVRFYSMLVSGELLDETATDAILDWLRLSPADWSDQPWTSPLANLLPPGVQHQILHKAGWLPAACCNNDTNIVIDAGVIYTADTSYAIAIATSSYGDFDSQVAYMSWVSCEVYAYLSLNAETDCRR